MPSDAHSHPYYLRKTHEDCELERARLNIACAASAFSEPEFIYNEKISLKKSMPEFVPGFAVHPQLPARACADDSLAFLYRAVREKRAAFIGETGFDLYDAEYKATEKEQEALFAEHSELAKNAGLPLVLHVRRAIHKIFRMEKTLRAVPALVFHGYSGTADEAKALLRRGMNAYFSFGTAICLNHKKAMAAAASLPAQRLLFETDAPYQPLRGKDFSTYSDIDAVISAAALLRSCDKKELEAVSDATWREIFIRDAKDKS